MKHETDIAIIGAGAAGLAAGKFVQQASVAFQVLEARGRNGGRAWTDTDTFGGVSFDRGCHWLHSASINPLRAEADRLGIPYLKQKSWRERQLFYKDRWLDPEELTRYHAALDSAFEALEIGAEAGIDIPASDSIDRALPYRDLIDYVYAQVTSAAPEDVSVIDLSGYEETHEDYPVARGYGALVQRIAEGLPVTLNTSVDAIDWSGSDVRINTSDGTLRAKAVILTVSTNVLASGGIRFTPQLPTRVSNAIDSVPLGCAEKVAFLLDAPLESIPPTSFASVVAPEGEPIYFQINPFGRPLIVAHMNGPAIREILAEGDAAMIAYARDRLIAGFGSDIAKSIKGAAATEWGTDPFILGGYSNAVPGKAHLRRVLAEPFSDRLLLAGEATNETAFASAHGAHISGIRAAKRALSQIGISTPVLS